jgi:hypothetical protein
MISLANILMAAGIGLGNNILSHWRLHEFNLLDDMQEINSNI